LDHVDRWSSYEQCRRRWVADRAFSCSRKDPSDVLPRHWERCCECGPRRVIELTGGVTYGGEKRVALVPNGNYRDAKSSCVVEHAFSCETFRV